MSPAGATCQRHMCVQHVVGQLPLQLCVSACAAPTVPGPTRHPGRLAGRHHAG
jgi:hypothetical protein